LDRVGFPCSGARSQPANQRQGNRQPRLRPHSTSNNHPRSPEAFRPSKATRRKETPRSGSFVVAPLPISSPALGSGVITGSCLYLPSELARQDITSFRHWGAGLITNNGSRAFALAGDLFFLERIPIMPRLVCSRQSKLQLVRIGVDASRTGLKIPLEQNGQVFFVEFLRRLGWKFFLGPRFLMGESTITLRPSSGSTLPPPPDVGLRTNLRALGFACNVTLAQNRFYPRLELPGLHG